MYKYTLHAKFRWGLTTHRSFCKNCGEEKIMFGVFISAQFCVLFRTKFFRTQRVPKDNRSSPVRIASRQSFTKSSGNDRLELGNSSPVSNSKAEVSFLHFLIQQTTHEKSRFELFSRCQILIFLSTAVTSKPCELIHVIKTKQNHKKENKLTVLSVEGDEA